MLEAADRELAAQVPMLCLCGNMRGATRALMSLYKRHMQAAPIRAPQMSIFVTLELQGSMTIARLAALLTMDRTTLTRDLRPLEQQGFISVATGEDRRTKEV